MSTSMPPPCEVCGWLAAFASCIGFGSFGVPIKGAPVKLDPMVFQTYKTTVCFLTCWLVLAFGEEFVFSPWGIVSGIFWVPGGIATVYAIQTAGLAVAVGIVSSLITLVSFTWGIFIFEEQVHSKFSASLAIACMMLGLVGMSYFSSPASALHSSLNDEVDQHDLELENNQQELDCSRGSRNSSDSGSNCSNHSTTSAGIATSRRLRSDGVHYQGLAPHVDDDDLGECVSGDETPGEATQKGSLTSQSKHIEQLEESDPDSIMRITLESQESVVFGRAISKRHLGMMSAMFTGLWGGSIMAPMKYAPADARGTHFLISFAIGSAIVNVALWALRYMFCLYQTRCAVEAFARLPSFHLFEMWQPGLACGLLWSFGNFFSLISVFYLGEGVGYPLVQTSILISGMWGIFYFQEVRGSERIAKWFASSLLTVTGILLLSYEHHAI